MPQPRLTRQQRRQQIQGDVLAAAEAVFPQRGYHGTSVELIAAQAGLTTGAVYSNFDGKPDLFLAVYERRMDGWAAEIAASLQPAEPAAQAAEAGRFWREFVARDRDWILLELEFLAVAARGQGMLERFAAAWRRPRELTSHALTGAEAAGMLKLPLAPDQLALLLSSLGVGLLLERVLDPETVSDELFEDCLTGISRALSQ